MMKFPVIILLLLVTRVQAQVYTYGEAFPGITFTAPIEMLTPPDDSKRIFIVQQNGVIKVFPNKPGMLAADVKNFLNITSKIIFGGERGLLGMAFHPDYKTNGYFYVSYTRSGPLTSVVSRFKVKADNPNEADPSSEVILLTQTQPYDNHNGGKLAFGNDSYLYISFGDGGSGGDPQNNAQNLTNLLGKILRIDVDETESGLNYKIPESNPFYDNTSGYQKEIFAYGLRNVWKFSVDQTDGKIWAADVGQNVREEIDLIVSGGNYGWRLMEGTLCYNPASNCNPGNLILPIFEYAHADNNRSVTGGYVYRGIQIPDWTGHYIYGDYVSGRIWKLTYENNVATNEFLLQSGGLISSFGEDHHGEPFVVQYSTGNSGKLFRFFPIAPQAPENLVLSELGDSKKLEWTDQSNNELGFIIERSPTSASNFIVLDTIPNNTIEFTDELTGDETEYTYRIKAYNDGGASAYASVSNIIVNLEELFFDKIRVYPNPATQTLTIELPESQTESSFRILSITGTELASIQSSNQKTTVEVSHFTNGIYFLEIKNRLGSVIKKILINKNY